MKKEEKIIVSAYTGILMCNINDLYLYAQEKLGRPVFTHNMADTCFWVELREAVKDNFMALCQSED